jgi:hypothetical protein
MKKMYISSLFLMAFFISQGLNAQVITAWNFNNITPGDLNTATPSEGEGSLELLGDLTSPATGSTGSPSDSGQPNLALQTTGYPEQSRNNKSAGVQFNVSTEGFTDIIMSAEIRTSNTASRWVQIQYSTDGENFVDFGTPQRLGGMGDDNAGDGWHPVFADFSQIAEVNDNPNFAVRLVSAFSPIAFVIQNNGMQFGPDEAYEPARNPSTGANSNYAGGTWRFDLVRFFSSTGPLLNVNAQSLNFTQLLGYSSNVHSFLISGANITGSVNLSVDAPFFISLNPEGNYVDNIQIPSNNGLIDETTVFVILSAAEENEYEGEITISTEGLDDVVVQLSGIAFNTQVSYPEAYNLQNGDYWFNEWSPESAPGTYPENMILWTHATTDPDINTPFLANYACRYDLLTRSRFIGQGELGISFVNTGNSQFIGVCDGTDPNQTSGDTDPNGRAGALVLAVNTTPAASLVVKWAARTWQQNTRVNEMYFQYKLTPENDDNPNLGWVDVAEGLYIVAEDSTEMKFEIEMPEDCLGQESLLLRWVYTYADGVGQRAHLGIDDIHVFGMTGSVSDDGLYPDLIIYPNPVQTGNEIRFSEEVSGQLFNYQGTLIRSFANSSVLSTEAILPGLYFIRVGNRVIKLAVN